MKIIKTVQEMQELADKLRSAGKSIGFVPTMGYLHPGHLSLVRIAKQQTDFVVVSIFVNPLQFGPAEDFDRYPRDFKRDEQLLEKEGANAIFYPELTEMYPSGFSTSVAVEKLTEQLCGKSRPGHFTGVTTVVAKLFNIVKPDKAIFGQKDAQQAFVIKRMVRDLNFDIEIVIAPTMREPDGLAMSSRNSYLSPEERKESAVLYQALQLAENLIRQGEKEAGTIIKEMEILIRSKPSARIDYVSIVDTENLQPVKKIEGEVLIALAVRFGKTRLIDNILLRG
jgi:pantoate--beta-alanine ligase